jgi:ubiquinone/menaquinone biosynthesis C-methylase UbiE
MNVGPDEQAELMDAIKRADEDASRKGRTEVKIPKEIADGIEKSVAHFREVSYRNAAMEILQPSEILVWKADEPFPPKHKPVQQAEEKAGSRKYYGDVAAGYDAKRENSEKWKAENRLVSELLTDMPPGTTVLDCPCGTGRFLRLYEELGFNVICMDASDEMLKQAWEKGSIIKNYYVIGDARNLGLEDNFVDVAMMIRLTRWLSPEDCVKALKEMQRVATKRVIFTARVRAHPHARGYDLIESALDGWKIHTDAPIADENLRMIELRPA